MESSYGINISSVSIRRRLNEASLRGCITQLKTIISKKIKNPDWTLSKKTLRNQWVFGKIFYGATNPNLPMGIRWKTLYMASSTPTTQFQIHHQNNLEWWRQYYGVRCIFLAIVRISSRMDQHLHKHIIENTMIPYADDNLPLIWQFMHDNDPKHTSRCL